MPLHDRRRGQLGKFFAPLRADDAIENELGASGARLTEGHDDSGNDEGARKSNSAPPMPATIPSAVLVKVAELRRQALNGCRQIRMGQ